MEVYVVFGYTGCSYTMKALNLLSSKKKRVCFYSVERTTVDTLPPGVTFGGVVTNDTFKEYSHGQSTVPQIYDSNDVYVGGFTDLEKRFAGR